MMGQPTQRGGRSVKMIDRTPISSRDPINYSPIISRIVVSLKEMELAIISEQLSDSLKS